MQGNSSIKKTQDTRDLKEYMQKDRGGNQFDIAIAILVIIVITAIFVHQETAANIPNSKDKKK